MRVDAALDAIRRVAVAPQAPPGLRSAASRLARRSGAEVVERPGLERDTREPGMVVLLQAPTNGTDAPDPAIAIRLQSDGSGRIVVPHPRFAYGFIVHLVDRLHERPLDRFEAGARLPLGFDWQRSVYDFFLTQEGRIQHGMDKDAYLEALAARGFTHVEVNGLAFREGVESGPPGEIYPMFYTYCPALDQFVSTDLNDGLYPADYLEANLANLERNAALAAQYGLVPGLLCFEPRSVPEAFFDRYPMLRGARVDHPFRSFKPRYNMTITHPIVRRHYAEMVKKLLAAVPTLGFLSIWSNDSGAGFEHTRSLYVGRNGGAYLIREWMDDAAIARAAGENVIRFLRALRTAGRERNPAFRVMTRLESFYGEHEAVWDGLGDAVEIETASIIARGWELPYTHPSYPESHAINPGSIYQDRFDPQEIALATELESRDAHPHFYVATGPHAMFAPLVGVPYPRLTGRRLQMLHANGVRHVAHLGGTPAPWLVPFDPNHEMAAAVQFDPDLDVDLETSRIATRWATARFAPTLLEAWAAAERAILAYPGVTPLYSMYGFVWYRLWLRPLVPNIEALSDAERAYYQDYMCTTPHNPNNVDLARDVLFQLTTPQACRASVERMDAHVWTWIDRAIDLLAAIRDEAHAVLGNGNVMQDQDIRLRALRCWLRTQHSVASWITNVHGYLEARQTGDHAGMDAARRALAEMTDREVRNSEELIALDDSDVEFMATTDQSETQLVHGRNVTVLLRRRIELMAAHRDDEPWIDPNYVSRRAGGAVAPSQDDRTNA